MGRIEGPTISVDLFGVGKDGFKRGNPLTIGAATVVTEGWLNAHQEYTMRVMEDLGFIVPSVLVPDHEALLRALDTKAFKAASANWLVPDYGFAGVGHGADFAKVPDAGTPDRDQWVLVGDASFGTQIFGDGNLHAETNIGSATVFFDVIHAFGPGSSGRWIEVGDTGVIKSTDAAKATFGNWTTRTSGTTDDLRGLGLRDSSEVLAVGDFGRWCHSVDGVTWTTGTTGAGHAYKACTYWNGEWWAVGTHTGGANGVVSRSTDHINWTHEDMGAGNFITDIVSDGTTIHMVTENGKEIAMYDPAKVIYTTITVWSAIKFQSIDFDGVGYVIGTDSGYVLTAHQGIKGVAHDWTPRKPALTEPDFNFVRAGAGRWVAGGSGGDIVLVSDARF